MEASEEEVPLAFVVAAPLRATKDRGANAPHVPTEVATIAANAVFGEVIIIYCFIYTPILR